MGNVMSRTLRSDVSGRSARRQLQLSPPAADMTGSPLTSPGSPLTSVPGDLRAAPGETRARPPGPWRCPAPPGRMITNRRLITGPVPGHRACCPGTPDGEDGGPSSGRWPAGPRRRPRGRGAVPGATGPATLPGWYPALLSSVSTRVSEGQQRAVTAANRELLATYWAIGADILARQHKQGWGEQDHRQAVRGPAVMVRRPGGPVRVEPGRAGPPHRQPLPRAGRERRHGSKTSKPHSTAPNRADTDRGPLPPAPGRWPRERRVVATAMSAAMSASGQRCQ